MIELGIDIFCPTTVTISFQTASLTPSRPFITSRRSSNTAWVPKHSHIAILTVLSFIAYTLLTQPDVLVHRWLRVPSLLRWTCYILCILRPWCLMVYGFYNL